LNPAPPTPPPSGPANPAGPKPLTAASGNDSLGLVDSCPKCLRIKWAHAPCPCRRTRRLERVEALKLKREAEKLAAKGKLHGPKPSTQ